jgi:hypothetical protein
LQLQHRFVTAVFDLDDIYISLRSDGSAAHIDLARVTSGDVSASMMVPGPESAFQYAPVQDH